ncbi:hypothetical protein lacNasYZ03_09940 [Lactobacillus nasalidis]|uniref:Uncharacterized protein n=1 Tax=Lactobacillus nasalidis TaxID=2797258 RepID=A0ABQ3W8W2_9LACO|nr:hypothetical protein [Lactobacillus nasalidis]GHV98109.1 hypothetical protein lacNasYZ01_12910 [Lactobacillus nasalidis]GHV99770.1 hypothetical protein lacNasYZ02_12000 [Lactobacillus nasalidis]GHW01307.1 hypothetical protein lacNasYZ03_09940 [Lactobacillus nasalidis]
MTELLAGFGKGRVEIQEQDLPLREFTAKSSDLYVRVALLRQGEEKFALASFELTSLMARDVTYFKQLLADEWEIAADQVWIAVSHNFSSPHLKQQLNNDEEKAAYRFFLKKLTDALETAFHEAAADLSPAKLAYSQGPCPINVNRNVETDQGWWLGRNFQGFSDHQVRALLAENASGASLIYSFDLQSSVLDHLDDDQGRRVIDGDIFGACSRFLEENYRVAIPLVGAAGDQRPLFTGSTERPFTCNQQLVSLQGAALAQAIEELTYRELEGRIKQTVLQASLPGQMRQKDTFDIRPTKSFVPKPGPAVAISLSALQLGNLTLLATQPELNSAFGRQIRQRLGLSMLASLVNGGVKYLPEASDFEKMTYEAMNSSLGPGSDQAFLKLVEEIKQKLAD